jgi:hypothetical protein
MVSILARPPFKPPLRPILARYSRISGGSRFLPMLQVYTKAALEVKGKNNSIFLRFPLDIRKPLW